MFYVLTFTSWMLTLVGIRESSFSLIPLNKVQDSNLVTQKHQRKKKTRESHCNTERGKLTRTLHTSKSHSTLLVFWTCSSNIFLMEDNNKTKFKIAFQSIFFFFTTFFSVWCHQVWSLILTLRITVSSSAEVVPVTAC